MKQVLNLWVKRVFFSWKTLLNAYLYCQMQQKLIMKNHVLSCCQKAANRWEMGELCLLSLEYWKSIHVPYLCYV